MGFNSGFKGLISNQRSIVNDNKLEMIWKRRGHGLFRHTVREFSCTNPRNTTKFPCQVTQTAD